MTFDNDVDNEIDLNYESNRENHPSVGRRNEILRSEKKHFKTSKLDFSD